MKDTALKNPTPTNNKSRLKVLMASLSLVSISAIAVTGYQPQITNNTLKGHISTQDELISKQIEKQKEGYVKNIKTNTEKIVEAIRLATAQEAMSSAQIAKADKDSKQVLVNAMLADNQAEAAMEAMLKYGSSTGQGYAACKVLAENAQVAQVMNTVPAQAAVKVETSDNSPNRFASSLTAASQSRNEIHNENFCTDTEGKQGTCKPAAPELQGADSNAATLMVSAPPESEVAKAKQAVRQNILGSPNIAVPRTVASTAAGQAYLYSVNHKTALASFPAYSLAYLEAMSEIREDVKDADGNPQSPNDMLLNTVARYYGGADSAEWQASMVAQQPRGLLVELAKMEGLGAWMDYQELVGTQRMEGNIAAMTLVSTLPIEERLNKQLVRTKRKATLNNIN